MSAAKPLAGRTIGFIGLGLMGRPMACNLARAGARMIIHNRSRGVVEELAAEGMEAVAGPAEVAGKAGMIILMLSDTAAVEAVVEGPGGLLEGVRPGCLVVDMGTTAVAATRRLADKVAMAGGSWLDAPVSGGQVGAAAASLSIMAGGSDNDFAMAEPVFRCLGRQVTHMGGIGTGQVAKAANQVIVGLTIGAVAEAMALAEKGGVAPARLREALMGGFASSRILELHGDRMARHDFTPGARATTQRKDLDQALQLAGLLDIELPATALCRDLYDRLIEQGDGGLDHSALFRLFSGR
ncbi:NAD(P)-dependent oxidoreductase [Telmatospirillum sp. J64-1]|uniref:NAD(P)-dependent oxidoreductase n=1 Tax=Telmatospirillum sp. J64-1 TaxID=2502183 RepID=UPI00115CB10B|nr:NAD(P)-dependent oxidoreductase [Telmatospirillum sp. J64-1]